MAEAGLPGVSAQLRPSRWRATLTLLRYAAVGCACIFLLADA